MVGKKDQISKKKRKGDIFSIAERLGAPRGGPSMTNEQMEKLIAELAFRNNLEKDLRIAKQDRSE
jgi:hypothetical protein